MFKTNLILISVFLLSCISCSFEENSNQNNNSIYYKVECKHPRGTVREYIISQYEYNYVYGYRSGVFNFKTLNGLQVKAVNCFATNATVTL